MLLNKKDEQNLHAQSALSQGLDALFCVSCERVPASTLLGESAA